MPDANARVVHTSSSTGGTRSRQPWAPLLWAIFSAGGTVAALLYTVHLLVTAFAFPLSWVPVPRYEALLGLARHPLARLYLFVLIALPLFHWAHRFRYTLYDGLQLKHLERPIAVLCYGAAVAATVFAALAISAL